MIISIIIATYNSEKFLQRCLSSIRTQKIEGVELIIVDNKSYDRTSEIIEKNRDVVDNFICESDNGIYDAWNKGLAVALGEWVMFMGSDDTLMPDAIQYYYSLNLEPLTYDYIAPVINMVTENGNFVRHFGAEFKWEIFKEKMNLAHVGALHSKALFSAVGNFDSTFKVCGDYELLLRKKMSLKVKFVDKIVAKMQLGGVSQTKTALFESRRARGMYLNKISYRSELIFLIMLVKYFLRDLKHVQSKT